jgi:hypothetical protein
MIRDLLTRPAEERNTDGLITGTGTSTVRQIVPHEFENRSISDKETPSILQWATESAIQVRLRGQG